MDIDVSQLTPQPKTNLDRLFLTVYSTVNPEVEGFKGFVKSVSSHDPKGDFDVLPQHANFVTQIKKSIEIVPEQGEKLSYLCKTGVLEVANNIVRVYLKP